jgi:hypothetical protein
MLINCAIKSFEDRSMESPSIHWLSQQATGGQSVTLHELRLSGPGASYSGGFGFESWYRGITMNEVFGFFLLPVIVPNLSEFTVYIFQPHLID